MAFENEAVAIRARIKEIEDDLSKRIDAIQKEAHARVMGEIRRADEELFPARLFLRSVGVDIGNDIPRSGLGPSGESTRPSVDPSRTKRSPSVARTKSSNAKPSGRKGRPKSVRASILEMLNGAGDGVLEAEIDQAVAGMGLTKDASRKAKGYALKSGVIKVEDGRFHITDAGRAELVAGSNSRS